MTHITTMPAASTQRQFDPGISSEFESVVSYNKMLKKAKVIRLFQSKLEVLHRDKLKQNIIITSKDLLSKKEVLMCKQLGAMLWELQLQLQLMQYTDSYKWPNETSKRLIDKTLDSGKSTLTSFKIDFKYQNFPSQEIIQCQEERCEELSLQLNVPVSILEIKQVDPVSEFCKPIVERGNADRRVKVWSLNYATFNDFLIYENCSDLIQKDIKLVDVKFRYQKVLVEKLDSKDTYSIQHGYKAATTKQPKILPSDCKWLNNLIQLNTMVFDRGKNMTVENVKNNELRVMLRKYWVPLAFSDFLKHIWSSNLTLEIEGIYGAVFDRGKFYTANPMDEIIVIGMNK